VGGRTRVVTLSHHSLGDDIMQKNLASIIRQSGLPKKLFR
jgi:predicted RNA binding protein YcfA (HicA-like mRNA interferase family)